MTKKLSLFFAACIAAGAITFFLYHKPSEEKTEIASEIPVIEMDSVVQVPEPTLLYGIPVDSMVIFENKVRRNESLASILSGYNVPHLTIHELAKEAKEVFDVRKIAPNKKYTLICASDSLNTPKSFVYEPSDLEYIVFHFGDSIKVDRKVKEVTIKEKKISGVIEYSLAETMDELGASPSLTNRFVDIFGWQVDFQRLQKGDRFKLIYEELSVEDKVVGFGEIKGIYFEHFNNPYYAIPYDQGDGKDYFDEDGNSLRKALLKYPIEFTRISSRYTRKRYHPVQKRYKAHLGTDFAAPTGTKIRTVGDGIVLEARYKGGNGNYVKIRHNATYTTQYLHMSKIASGMRPGMKVKQGQIIGYVGSTGLATGPHLCYRFWLNGRQVDALKVNLPPSAPIDEENVENYDVVKIQVMQKLDSMQYDSNPEFFASAK